MSAERTRLISAFYQNRLAGLRATLERRLEAGYRAVFGASLGRAERVALSAIILDDAGRQPLSQAIVAETVRRFDEVDPIQLRPAADGRFTLADGRHRIEAARRLDRSEIDAIVAADVEIDPAFDDLVARSAPLIHAAQASALLLSAAYLRMLFAEQAGQTIETGDAPREMIGVTKRGLPLAAGMAAIPAMVKAHIGSGHTLPESLQLGEYLTKRFADREVVRVADESTERIARQTREVIGWRGHVQPDSCDECRANEGEHGLDFDFYRHGSCRCEREWIVRVNAAA